MRLIDADALVQILDEYDLQLMIGWVEDAPAIDAVPVVRCRECKFNPKHEWTGCPKAGTWREFNYEGFCSDGKRREDGDA